MAKIAFSMMAEQAKIENDFHRCLNLIAEKKMNPEQTIYQVNPGTTLEEIQKVEQKLNIRMSTMHKTFLMHFNGCKLAWPLDCEIFSLSEIEEHYKYFVRSYGRLRPRTLFPIGFSNNSEYLVMPNVFSADEEPAVIDAFHEYRIYEWQEYSENFAALIILFSTLENFNHRIEWATRIESLRPLPLLASQSSQALASEAPARSSELEDARELLVEDTQILPRTKNSCRRLKVALMTMSQKNIDDLTDFKETDFLHLTWNDVQGPIDLSRFNQWKLLKHITLCGDDITTSMFLEQWIDTDIGSLKLQVHQLLPQMIETLSLWSHLDSLDLQVGKVTLDTLSLIDFPQKLRRVCVRGPESLPWTDLQYALAQAGLANVTMKKGRLTAGGRYEDSKLSREFLCIDDNRIETLLTLSPGDKLEIYSRDQKMVYQGTLTPEVEETNMWDQNGVDPQVWESWFRSGLPAHVTTFDIAQNADLGFFIVR